jgi:molybdate transport system regulatory protein
MKKQRLINNNCSEGGLPGVVSADMARNTATVPKAPLPDNTADLPPLDQPIMRLHLWLETEKGIFFGMGRQRLLECIRSGLSLKAAADHLGMSYRAAWGKIKQTEKVLGIALIEKKGGNRSGYQLTPAGKMLTARFGQWYTEVEQFALARSRTLMSCNTLSFEDAGARHTEKSLPKT